MARAGETVLVPPGEYGGEEALEITAPNVTVRAVTALGSILRMPMVVRGAGVALEGLALLGDGHDSGDDRLVRDLRHHVVDRHPEVEGRRGRQDDGCRRRTSPFLGTTTDGPQSEGGQRKVGVQGVDVDPADAGHVLDRSEFPVRVLPDRRPPPGERSDQ